MIKITIFMAALFSTTPVAQHKEKNPFVRAEQEAQQLREQEEQELAEAVKIMARGPGDPDGSDDLPIDGYLPFLAITAVGLIVCYSKKHKLMLK